MANVIRVPQCRNALLMRLENRFRRCLTLSDEINKPLHYFRGGIDVIGFAERQFSVEERRGFYRISALKYITRFQDKGAPVKDLKKCKFYIEKRIEVGSDRNECH